jgi:hypothetical protein
MAGWRSSPCVALHPDYGNAPPSTAGVRSRLISRSLPRRDQRKPREHLIRLRQFSKFLVTKGRTYAFTYQRANLLAMDTFVPSLRGANEKALGRRST